MKFGTKILALFAAVVLAVGGFSAGRYVADQENMQTQQQRCRMLIGFAVDKAESEDLSNPDTMEALISNVYAAYYYCDEPAAAEQLHDLWNTLIFEPEAYTGGEEVLVEALQGVAHSVGTAP